MVASQQNEILLLILGILVPAGAASASAVEIRTAKRLARHRVLYPHTVVLIEARLASYEEEGVSVLPLLRLTMQPRGAVTLSVVSIPNPLVRLRNMVNKSKETHGQRKPTLFHDALHSSERLCIGRRNLLHAQASRARFICTRKDVTSGILRTQALSTRTLRRRIATE